MTDYLSIPKGASLFEHEGKKVAIIGRVSRTPWQHLIDSIESHPCITYLDLGKNQIVVYSQDPLPEQGDIEIRGTLFRLVGSSKRPGSTDRYTEIQLVADSWSLCEKQAPGLPTKTP
ncbi:MAG: hypothetical protein JW797_20375 [Bradymonadales bacterium]|nr:hypothetical protein [Bradymonadales bacterium]